MLNKTAAGLGPFSGFSPSHTFLTSSVSLILLYVAKLLWLGAAVELKSALGSCAGHPQPHVSLCLTASQGGQPRHVCVELSGSLHPGCEASLCSGRAAWLDAVTGHRTQDRAWEGWRSGTGAYTAHNTL